jgi:tetratricopeptide (TPR) repeat protein/predicted Ser/Thr protein kinase
MTRANDNDREFPTLPSDRGAPSDRERLGEGFDETEMDESLLAQTEIDPWHEAFDQSVPDRRDIDGELLEAKMLVELFGGEPPEVVIGQYVIERRLGHGGMGEVYAGRDLLADHEVAIKLLRPTDEVTIDRQRLLGEARALAKVKHPNVIPLYHIGEHDGRLFIAMERVQGRTLAQWQTTRPKLRALLRIYAAAARGLAAAHHAGVVHGDFKPSNVLLAEDGRVLVSDFGVASIADEHDSGFEGSARGGTVLYMAPERARGEDGDFRSDQFSFFTALFLAIHGVGPVPGSSHQELLANLSAGRIVLAPKGARLLPGWLRRAFERGLAIDPRRRFTNMDEVAALLERKASPKLAQAVALVGTAALCFGIGLAMPPELVETPVVDPLADVWSVEQRRAIEAHDRIAGVTDELDKWAQKWRSVNEDHSQYPESRACLDVALDRFDALVERLGEEGISNKAAFIATEQLPDPKSCVGDPLVPPEQLSEVERIAIAKAINDAELARLDLRFAEASERANEALARAKRAQWLGARLDALEVLGLVLNDQRQRPEAIAKLEEALALAVESKKTERVAELAVELALVDSEFVRSAAIFVTGMRDKAPPQLRAKLAIARANEQLFRGAFEDAEKTLRDATNQLDVEQLSPYLEIKLRRRLADAIGEQGHARALDAEQAYQEAFDRAEARLGGRYDAVEKLKLLSNMAVTASHNDKDEDAKKWFAMVDEQVGKLLPSEHVPVAEAFINLAHADIAREDCGAAQDRIKQGLQILNTLRVSQELVSQAYGVDAMAHWACGDHDAALGAIDRAIEVEPRADLMIQRAMFLAELGRDEDAIEGFLLGLTAYERGPKSPDELATLVNVWEAWLRLLNQQKKSDLAAREFERISTSYDHINEADLDRLAQAALRR